MLTILAVTASSARLGALVGPSTIDPTSSTARTSTELLPTLTPTSDAGKNDPSGTSPAQRDCAAPSTPSTPSTPPPKNVFSSTSAPPPHRKSTSAFPF
ncbi:hypothetical protein AAT19DRAFT_14204 [Rhodotorula toruloides]|uniref:Secreted protein n=1 Tax=Rhodotorula toruloides TaxID=5286 RepID=A0A2T0AB01_RHOTO|nr:hypothetical protein AAT19DRAFT_14204 [Rhodotorula toruloides]